MITPVKGSPAAILRVGKERILAVADLHLGIESWLSRDGISIPSQSPKIRARLLELIDERSPDRLIIIGDLKHGIPVSSWQEWRELPELLEELKKHVKVEVVKGNHDGGIEEMLPSGVIIHDAHGTIVGKRVGLMHGHTWPSPSMLKTSVILLGHIHPSVEFRDKMGGRATAPVWLRCTMNPEKMPKKIEKHAGKKLPKLIVLPAFSDLVGYAPVNREMPGELIGPLFRSGVVNLSDAEVYMLDGTFVGKVNDMKKRNQFR
ncbi:MAG: metallophosphoesterase [Candidatus Hadarchaeales archaeon]